MKKAKVFFTNFRTIPTVNNRQSKLDKLLKNAGIETIDFDRKFTAIKMHFGEPGNLSFLRPNYAKTVVDYVKRLGGRPFLTDCNTLYVGRRKNALDHIDAAYENGFSPFSTGCHILIADGLKGNNEKYVKIDQEYVKEAKIGLAIMDADILISLTHFKGHESTGFGGALRISGWVQDHAPERWKCTAAENLTSSRTHCIGCGKCVQICAQDAQQSQSKIQYRS